MRPPLLCCRANDVQVELVMLDPYVRATLQHDGQGRFAAQARGAGRGGLRAAGQQVLRRWRRSRHVLAI